METKINIAEILKDKPQGTKLYDWLYNIDVELDTISTTDTETVVWCTNQTDNNTTCHRGYSGFGTVRGCNDGLQILLPSKEMRDWSKFQWKEGDILVNKDGDAHIIFAGFDDDTYKTFNGNNYLWENEGITMCFGGYEDDLQTSEFSKANKEDAQEYIRKIEKRLSGKLNRETLEVKKAQPEYKDGDIAFADFGKTQDVFIVSGKTNLSEGYYSFIALNLNSTKALSIGYKTSFFKEKLNTLRLATEEEKQQLFDALAEEGKRWDADKKMIIDLKPKVELKPFDKVLVRDSKSDKWRANLFGYIGKDGYYRCVYANWVYCIPYIGNESLLGTTKDVEG